MRAGDDVHRRESNRTEISWNDLHVLARRDEDQLVLIKRNRVQICTKPPIGWLTVLMASPALAN